MSSVQLRPPQVTARPLRALVTSAVAITGDPETPISSISLDSRSVIPGTLYAALSGTKVHGAEFVGAAVAGGAVAILTDPAGAAQALATGVAVVVSDQPRAEMAHAAAVMYDHPADQVTVFGVTGTTGKTTTTFLVEAMLRAAGERVATIGTIGFRLDGITIPTTRSTVTTPESVDLQPLLAGFVSAGATSVAMEVSSHALALHRVDEINFTVAAFTNLGEDHQDFHPNVEDYFEAKARLFEPQRCRVAVINIDSEWGQRLATRVRATTVPVVTTGAAAQADYRLGEVITTESGVRVSCVTPQGPCDFEQDLPGVHNALNALTALAMVVAAGVDLTTAVAGLRHASVPGRLQPIRLGPSAPSVRVDFAHTPEAIEQAIAAVGKSEGRLVVVVGAGGDRDQAKRPPMGVAAAQADLVIVTDDNPRIEDPAEIRAAVLTGARSAATGEVVEIADRREAIAHALGWASEADTILVLGKGHEQGQEFADRIVPFDDAVVIVEEWARLQEANS